MAGRPCSIDTRSRKRVSRPMDTKARANHQVRRPLIRSRVESTNSLLSTKENSREATTKPRTNLGNRSQITGLRGRRPATPPPNPRKHASRGRSGGWSTGHPSLSSMHSSLAASAAKATLVLPMSYSPGRPGRPPIFSTAVGTQRGPFGWLEWVLLTGVALIWGSSYLLIDIGLDALAPPVITWMRVTLGFAVLVGFPAARRPVDRSDRRRIVALGVVWTTVPFLLGPISQQHIDSALAGMLNGLVPISSAAIAMLLLRALPGVRQVAGILIGLVGAVSLGFSVGRESQAAAWGILLAVVAAILYGLALNMAVPLQQRYGAPAVMMRVLGVAAVTTAPFGIAGLGHSAWEVAPVVAVTVLGILNTGAAFVIMAVFVGRVGPTRGGVAIYFLPIVAMVLGVVFRSEVVLPLQWAGTGLVLVGAFLTSRRET